jgi:hypothetical protein
MDSVFIKRKFALMGARAKFSGPRGRQNNRPFTIDIVRDPQGEFFDIQVMDEIEMMILDLQKKDRHLLLMAKNPENDREPKSRFLCGHDERNWFVCAVPENPNSVFKAKQALKPRVLRELEAREGLKTSLLHKRHRRLKSGKKVFRQGEFMFVPENAFEPPKGSLTTIHRHEPMSRGGGNAHIAEQLYRFGGNRVYVSSYSAKARTQGLTEQEFQTLLLNDPSVKKYGWNIRVRNPQVYVRGKITHREHKTVDLGAIWHRVLLNTEDIAFGARNVAFLD